MSKLEIYCVTNKAIKSLEKFQYKLCAVGKTFSIISNVRIIMHLKILF